ncbi:LPD7 domain-containing protein [Sphingomonas sp. CROZ-RG-20F-R02-07]|uniref:LPD7 domain-containing protein n=1 Tax=Sphingomonas sp. CROZ-RG-20F-R02-07 TaxID=2914832 RepID=UPI001F5A28CF|nr:LPD7 domain-containing protein [Sphingomonas sp. CROZ-RG-20F-R02-07]
MSVDNSVARPTRDVELDAGEAGFTIPPDLAERYEVRIIPASDASERRIGMILPGDRENPSIEVSGNGDRIIARNEDPETVAALVKLAKHNGWEGIDVDGSTEFRQTVWAAGSREGLTVRGYEPDFTEQARMEQDRRGHAQAVQREREAAAKPARAIEPAAPVVATAAIDATIPARTADAARDPVGAASPAQNGAELSDDDKRLLLRLSVYTQDRKALSEGMTPDLEPMEREFRYERLEVNKEALDGALEQALESPTLVRSFSKAGYETDDLRRMAREGEWDGEVADAIYLVRSGLNRHDVAKETVASFVQSEREDERAAASTVAPKRKPEPEPQIVREERQHEATATRTENEELAELFLRGSAERIAADPRLANAVETQAAMEQHIGVAFSGDADRMMSASLESRELISGALMRGLDVSVREPTPVRQIEPIQITHDLER